MTAATSPVTRRGIAEALVTACREAGTGRVFGVPGGGSNLDVVGAAQAQGLEFVLVHTETAAAVMAGVTGQLSGAPGLCVATRGPGLASAVNGLAQALLDRQPMLLVTDCVAQADRSRVSHQRLDQQALAAPVTLASLVLDGRDPGAAASAVRRALRPRPGPVHVDLDPTATPATTASAGHPDPGGTEKAAPAEGTELDRVLSLVAAARRPVMLVGVGAVALPPRERAAVAQALELLGRAANLPMLCSYTARGVVPDGASWNAGVATGATIEAPVLAAADLVVGIGLDPVELIPAPWPHPAPVVLLGSWPVDDSDYLGDRLAVVGAEAVGDLAALVRAVAARVDTTWPAGAGAQFRRQAQHRLLSAVPESPDGLTPQQVVTQASQAAPARTVATVDAGAHMLVAVPLWRVETPGRLLVSSGLATMGFALPAAIAAALADRDRAVVCFTGDGGLGMVLAELETLARLALRVVVVVFNDATLSLIAVKQDAQGHGGPAAVGYRRTDFAAVARACGVSAEQVDDVAGYRRALRVALDQPGPTLLDVRVDPRGYGAVLDAIRG